MSVFTYNDGVPGSNNDPSEDQPDMLVNTQSIQGILDIDHFTFGTGIDVDGRHKQASMKNQSAPGIPTGFNGIYYVNNNVPMFQNASNANNNIATYVGTPVTAQAGQTFLPGGILMQWGRVNSPSSTGSVVFPTAFSVTYNVQITMQRNSSSSTQGMYVNGNPSTTGFSYNGSSGGNALFWVAIGAA